MRILTWNMRFGEADDGPNHWKFRGSRFLEALERAQADVACLQEALELQIREILAFDPELAAIGVGREDGRAKGEGCAILFRRSEFVVAEAGSLWLSESGLPGQAAWGASNTRMATWAVLRAADGGSFRVVNSHWDHESELARVNAATLLARRFAASDEPLLFAGDFNEEADGPAVQTLAEWPDRPLRNAFFEAHPGRRATTYHGFEPAREGPMIDHLLFDDRWALDSCDVLTEPPGPPASDHFALVADLRRL